MILVTDSREQAPLEFVPINGVTYKVACIPVGDYTAEGQNVVIERKSIGDLWGSYNAGYANERAKILKAKELGIQFILAIEASCFDIRRGFSYWKDGEEHSSKVDGMTMLKKLFTVSRKYGVELWFCNSRKEMAFMIQEYLLAEERVRKDERRNLPDSNTASGA